MVYFLHLSEPFFYPYIYWSINLAYLKKNINIKISLYIRKRGFHKNAKSIIEIYFFNNTNRHSDRLNYDVYNKNSRYIDRFKDR